MCGIAGIISIKGKPIKSLESRLQIMGQRIAHRGPDGYGFFTANNQNCGLAHRRLAIIDLTETGAQPMRGKDNTCLVHNGEIYNYIELREEIGNSWDFSGTSDTETIIAAHANWGKDAVNRFRGMWAYALWNENEQSLFICRDPFGIKPLYYAIIDDVLYFASEVKAILPFLKSIETDEDAFADYVSFQFPMSEQTLFKGVKQLLPAHFMEIKNGSIQIKKYWDVDYQHKENKSSEEFNEELQSLLNDSMKLHLRADVPVGAYVSGGVDSSLVAILSAGASNQNRDFFHGKFTCRPGYDESNYAKDVAKIAHGTLHEIDISANDMIDNLNKVIYHLDYPIAGPGSFPQYMVSQLCAKNVKVVLGGQGGDEIFGGYTRYVIGYLEHALKAEIEQTANDQSTPIRLNELIGNLPMLKQYTPMMQMFFKDGMFGDPASRYYRLAGRAADLKDEIALSELPMDGVFQRFEQSYNAPNIGENAVFDKMTRFDYNWLLPALLHVEDRMGMAHGLESRVPILDKPIVEFAARLPMREKINNGDTKQILKNAFKDVIPQSILARKDKMGFPFPFKEWFENEMSGYLNDTFNSQNSKSRPFINHSAVLQDLSNIGTFSRKIWGLLSLEIWYQTFHDKSHEILINDKDL